LPKHHDIKDWVSRSITRADKLLITLAAIGEPCPVKTIKDLAIASGLREAKSWNISQILSRSKNLADNTASGWEITNAGKIHLSTLGFSKASEATVKVTIDLRIIHARIQDGETRDFVEEAIKAFELELYRSAVVMSWLAAVDVLRKEVIRQHLADFNKEAFRANNKWKPAKTADDLSSMKEGEFLDRLAAISLLGKNVKEELKKRLDLRNACGHPNSYVIGRNAVAHHIEMLLLNVFTKFT
jgi:hypothetical protein